MKRKRSVFKYVAAGIVIMAAAAVVLVLLGDKSSKVSVLMTSVPINRGTIIAEGNVDDLFEVKKIDEDMFADNMICDKKMIIGKTLSSDMEVNAVLCTDNISDVDNNAASMANPVVAGIRAADISQFSGGIIRAGDHIDISVVDSNTGKCSNVISNAFVTGAFNSDGTAVEGEGCAMILNVLIEKETEQYLNEMLAMGTVRVCRLERSSDG